MFSLGKGRQPANRCFCRSELSGHYPGRCQEKRGRCHAPSEKILNKFEHLKKELIPADVQVTTTRNYGESASQKVSELLLHLFFSILAVTLFVMLAMGWRGGLVVFLSVPVTFALTLFSYYFMGYTLNRITLFALVFVTGIVVDDSIIIAENMHRHFKMKKRHLCKPLFMPSTK
jgi:multidrug efflux pump subunit AcrB